MRSVREDSRFHGMFVDLDYSSMEKIRILFIYVKMSDRPNLTVGSHTKSLIIIIIIIYRHCL